MVSALPGLVSAIKMMHSIARYYNTSERMTSLFVKVTNQMIICCKNYILRPGKLWNQDKTQLVDRCKACLDLNEAYQFQYRKTKVNIISKTCLKIKYSTIPSHYQLELRANPHGKQFDFSESAIFGKFDQFCWRVQKLIDLFATVQQFSALGESTIENIQPIVKEFEEILAELKRKKYNFLDYRSILFDNDYMEFNYKIQELEQKLVDFINDCFVNSKSTSRSLKLLYQFKIVLKQEDLQKLLDEKYRAIFKKYGDDLAKVMKIYNTHKDKPPLPRNAPKVAGSIAWARQLLRQIEQPMELFKRTPAILESKVSFFYQLHKFNHG